ncbi:MAG: hypothetical protein P8Y24_07650 [Gammaproteobacteria bacterium]|jgi:hypothetical protein
MKAKNIDVFIYMKSAKEPAIINDAVTRVKSYSGVTIANAHPSIRNMMRVKYDASRISSSDIVHVINNNHQDAVVVGM